MKERITSELTANRTADNFSSCTGTCDMIGSNLNTTDKQTNKIEETVDQKTIVNKLFSALASIFAFM